jgi:hypothetical protein
MKHLKPYLVSTFAITVLLATQMIAGPSAGYAATVELYDDFSRQAIDPAKWHGIEIGSTALAPNAEAVREIARGQLRLFLTT